MTQRRTAQAGNVQFLRGIMDSSLRSIADDTRRDIEQYEREIERAQSDLGVITAEQERRKAER